MLVPGWLRARPAAASGQVTPGGPRWPRQGARQASDLEQVMVSGLRGTSFVQLGRPLPRAGKGLACGLGVGGTRALAPDLGVPPRPQTAPPCCPNIPTPLVEGSGCALPSARSEVRTSWGLPAVSLGALWDTGSPVRTPALARSADPANVARPDGLPSATVVVGLLARIPCKSFGLGHSVPSSVSPQGHRRLWGDGEVPRQSWLSASSAPWGEDTGPPRTHKVRVCGRSPGSPGEGGRRVWGVPSPGRGAEAGD